MGITSNAARFSVIAAAALLLLSLVPSAGVVSTLVQDTCAGSSTANGIIAANPVVGLGSQGVGSVVGLTVIIMLAVVLVMAVVYMISQVIRVPSLENFIKVELAEMFGTMAIIAIFFTGFYAAALAGSATGSGSTVTNPNLHFNGPGRSIFVGDCEMIGGASIQLFPTVFITGVINTGLNIVDSFRMKITPGGFGFAVSPLQGLAMIPTTIGELNGILSAFMLVLLALNFLLGLIYALFPVFLYLGVVLRAFPWTRAAGGIFIAMFIGFYVVFPLMIYATVGGFASATYSDSYVAYTTSSSAAGISGFTSGTSTTNLGTVGRLGGDNNNGPGMMAFLGNVLYSMIGFPNSQGLINGYVTDFMGPAVMIMVEIAFSFIVALDFADILSDILGAPSLSTQGLLGRLV